MAEMTRERQGEIALAIVKQEVCREKSHRLSWYEIPANDETNISIEEAKEFAEIINSRARSIK